jgi:proline dehydrogenase
MLLARIQRARPCVRFVSTSARRPSYRYLTGLVFGSSALLGAWVLPTDSPSDVPNRLDKIPLSTLVRSYVVYSMCSLPLLVDKSPEILSALTSIPGAKQITEAFLRATFFSQVTSVQ